jgi:hypothetical protein
LSKDEKQATAKKIRIIKNIYCQALTLKNQGGNGGGNRLESAKNKAHIPITEKPLPCRCGRG